MPLHTGAAPCYVRAHAPPPPRRSPHHSSSSPSRPPARPRRPARSTSTTSRAPTLFVNSDGPLSDRYASLGVHFAGPAAERRRRRAGRHRVRGDRRERAERARVQHRRDLLAAPAAACPEGRRRSRSTRRSTRRRSASGRAAGGTVRLTAFDGTTPCRRTSRRRSPRCRPSTSPPRASPACGSSSAARATVWDDLTWRTSPVSGDDAFATRANNDADGQRSGRARATTAMPTATR